LWLRVPQAPLRWLLGEMSELLLRSQRVAPRRLQQSGFEFRYPDLEAALAELLRRERS
jgi:NAD dependent epimerase/dehydratase family enzyme